MARPGQLSPHHPPQHPPLTPLHPDCAVPSPGLGPQWLQVQAGCSLPWGPGRRDNIVYETSTPRNNPGNTGAPRPTLKQSLGGGLGRGRCYEWKTLSKTQGSKSGVVASKCGVCRCFGPAYLRPLPTGPCPLRPLPTVALLEGHGAHDHLPHLCQTGHRAVEASEGLLGRCWPAWPGHQDGQGPKATPWCWEWRGHFCVMSDWCWEVKDPGRQAGL